MCQQQSSTKLDGLIAPAVFDSGTFWRFLSTGLLWALFLAVAQGRVLHGDEDKPRVKAEDRAFHIVFGQDPGAGRYDGVVGTAKDRWNFVKVGTTEIKNLQSAVGRKSQVRLELSENNGCWGIAQHGGIFHAYLYHQNQAVDLQTTFHDLPTGRYAVYVFAHGDRPEQNARVEVLVGDKKCGSKPTANDGSWDFRSHQFTEGVQYVKFEASVKDGQPLRIVSHRDGSDYSMFNAIQVVPWPSRFAIEGEGKATPQAK